MGVGKVVFGGDVLVDLTADTVTAATLRKGITAHDAAGNKVVGTMEEAMILSGDIVACPTAAASVEGGCLSLADGRANVGGDALELEP